MIEAESGTLFVKVNQLPKLCRRAFAFLALFLLFVSYDAA